MVARLHNAQICVVKIMFFAKKTSEIRFSVALTQVTSSIMSLYRLLTNYAQRYPQVVHKIACSVVLWISLDVST